MVNCNVKVVSVYMFNVSSRLYVLAVAKHREIENSPLVPQPESNIYAQTQANPRLSTVSPDHIHIDIAAILRTDNNVNPSLYDGNSPTRIYTSNPQL